MLVANSEFINAALQQIAEELKASFADEIYRSGKVDSGNASNPDNFIVNIQDGVLTITSSLPYMGTLEDGRGPSSSGTDSVQRALEGWIRRKNLNLYKWTGAGEFTRVSTTDAYIRKTAYVMARKIHRGGWGEKYGFQGGVQFASKTINRLSDSIQQRLRDAYAKEIEQIMNKK